MTTQTTPQTIQLRVFRGEPTADNQGVNAQYETYDVQV